MGKFVDLISTAKPSEADADGAPAPITLSYGTMRDFQRGLNGLVGPPAPGGAYAPPPHRRFNLPVPTLRACTPSCGYEAMVSDHCQHLLTD
jgi:hypothetical protein